MFLKKPDTGDAIKESYNQKLLRSLEKKARSRLGKDESSIERMKQTGRQSLKSQKDMMEDLSNRLRASQNLKELSAIFRRQQEKPSMRTPNHPARPGLMY